MQDIDDNAIKIYTDGACSGNPGPGGWSAIILYNNKKEVIAGFDANTTNNRMEMMAAIKGILAIKIKSKIKIFTDSVYLKNGITDWIHNWKKNNWTNSSRKSVLNQDLWKELDLLNNNHEIEWTWIKGHNNDIYNEEADKYAVLAMNQRRDINIKN
tara:strand:- start:68 stop:535 length:468 start_codon:yes stop_codon:yes gene_type:complete